MLETLALNSLEKAINTYLRLDPYTIDRIKAIAGKRVLLEFKDIGISFYAEFAEDGIKLFKESIVEADTTISGTPISLMRAAWAGHTHRGLFAEDVSVSGDMELGQEVQAILNEIDIDWEAHLANLVGDVVATQVSGVVKQLFSWGKYAEETMEKNVSEFLQEEVRLFPPREEMNDFFDDVDLLREDVDRISARIKRLSEKT